MDLYEKNIKIVISDRNYSSWYFIDNINDTELTIEKYPILKTINPIDSKLFNKDIFNISLDGITTIRHSFIKNTINIAGVLILEGNKTFGRTSNNKRLFYKCIPDDKRLPVFIIPYEIKIGFSKVYKNKYIVFQFKKWDGKHPEGIIKETIGDIDNLDAFYEYQLYCKSIHDSITEFTNKTRSVLNEKSNDEYIERIFNNKDFIIEERLDKYIFTIDPPNSLDYDDAFGIEKLPNGDYSVSVYIANVYFWIETLRLWNSFSRRVSTIYLPDRRRPMLPTILSDILCSLQEGQKRFALVMDFIIDENGTILIEPTYKNVLINVRKNYNYEEPKMLLKDSYYQKLFDLSVKMDRNVKNSHDLVSFWMITMNQYSGKYMAKNKIGIFRSAIYINNESAIDIENNKYNLKDDTVRVINNWNNTVGQYLLYNDNISLKHELLNIQSYIHITSPIRRLVDLLNQMLLCKNIGLIQNMSLESLEFLKKWENEMEYINISMRSIRKVQTDCELMNRCFNMPNIMNIEYEGVLFDKIIKNDGIIQYMVYLENLKLLSRISTNVDIQNYTIVKFKLFLFEDEDKTKKKIRLQMI
jgi:exoribonuclease R